jgi:hypothetical protein
MKAGTSGRDIGVGYARRYSDADAMLTVKRRRVTNHYIPIPPFVADKNHHPESVR